MVLEFTRINTVYATKDIGRTICSMALEKKHDRKVSNMREIIIWEPKKDQVSIHTRMVQTTTAAGLITRLMGLVYSYGQMVRNTMEIGFKIISMVMGSTYIPIELDIQVVSKMIKNMVLVFINGQMDKYMKDGGIEDSSMDLAPTLLAKNRIIKYSMASGNQVIV